MMGIWPLGLVTIIVNEILGTTEKSFSTDPNIYRGIQCLAPHPHFRTRFENLVKNIPTWL